MKDKKDSKDLLIDLLESQVTELTLISKIELGDDVITRIKELKRSSRSSKWFLGWDNIKWFITEIGNIYTASPSYFSKKRIESSIAFIVGQVGMLWFLCENISKLTASDIVLWAGVEFAISGYIVSQIQKEKKQVEETNS
jgi:hypothetical protein